MEMLTLNDLTVIRNGKIFILLMRPLINLRTVVKFL